MCDVIYVNLVHIDVDIRIQRLHVEDKRSVGFPYCLLFYIPACFVVFVSVAALIKCLHDDIAKLSKARADSGLTNIITNHSQARAYRGPDGNEISMQSFSANPLQNRLSIVDVTYIIDFV